MHGYFPQNLTFYGLQQDLFVVFRNLGTCMYEKIKSKTTSLKEHNTFTPLQNQATQQTIGFFRVFLFVHLHLTFLCMAPYTDIIRYSHSCMCHSLISFFFNRTFPFKCSL